MPSQILHFKIQGRDAKFCVPTCLLKPDHKLIDGIVK